MKYYTAILCLFFTTITTAQIDVSLSTLSGYETNINRYPEQFIKNGILLNKEDLHLNSMYQDVSAKFKYTKAWRHSVLKGYFTPKGRLYFSEQELNQYILNARLHYKYNFEHNLKWETNAMYRLKDRSGQDLDQNELSIPFGYSLANISSGLHFRLYKNNRAYAVANYGYKSFDKTSTRKVSYYKYGLDLEFKNILWKNHLLHTYGVTLGFSNRDYDITTFQNNTNSSRTWQYFKLGAFYKLPLNKQWSIKPMLSFEERIDKTNNQFGYKQIKPQLEIEYKGEQFLGKLSSSYRKRIFKTLTAQDIEEEEIGILNYDYLRLKFDFEYKLNTNFSFVSEVYVLHRKSNNLNLNTTAYRSYNNNYVGIGMRYKF